MSGLWMKRAMRSRSAGHPITICRIVHYGPLHNWARSTWLFLAHEMPLMGDAVGDVESQSAGGSPSRVDRFRERTGSLEKGFAQRVAAISIAVGSCRGESARPRFFFLTPLARRCDLRFAEDSTDRINGVPPGCGMDDSPRSFVDKTGPGRLDSGSSPRR
jgi:hypothetical protein